MVKLNESSEVICENEGVGSEGMESNGKNLGDESVKMERRVTLLDGVTLIVGESLWYY